ncbi:MAG: EAL domain-containing protein [Kangiellaceae bacterium]|nr:EAL domain-containing protein [Kangiellaceae bacterium]
MLQTSYQYRAFQWIVACCLSLTTFQLSATNALIKYPQLTQVSSLNGLGQNTVNSFYEDAQGLIWITTLAGVNRFDGDTMLSLADKNSQFKNKSINSMTADELGRYWLSSNQGLVKIDSNDMDIETARFPAPQRFIEEANMIIGSDSLNPDKLIVFSWNGIYLYQISARDISQPLSMKIFQDSNNNIHSYSRDEYGYLLGSSNGLYHYNITTEKLTLINLGNQFKELQIRFLFSLENDDTAIAGDSGLFVFNTKEQVSNQLHSISNEKITGLTQTNAKLLFSTNDSIYQFDPVTKITRLLFSLAKTLDDHSEYVITDLFIDSRQLLWIGTQSQGAYIWDTKVPNFDIWNSQSQPDSSKLNDDMVWSLEIDEQNNYWVTTNSNVQLIDSKSKQSKEIISFKELNLPDKRSAIYDFEKQGSILWLATQEGLLEFHQNSRQLTKHVPQNLKLAKSPVVYSIVDTGDGVIWAATAQGLLSFDKEKSEFSYDRNIMTEVNAAPTRHVSYQKNKLWVGIENQLISYDLVSGKTKLIFNSRKNINGEFYPITDVLIENGVVWISYKGDGIYGFRLDSSSNEMVARYHTTKGLPDNDIFSLELIDRTIWASSSQGLLKINTKSKQHYLFTHKDGLHSNEFNEGATAVTNTGEILLGSIRGLIRVNPQKLVESKSRTAPIVSELALQTENGVKNYWSIGNKLPKVTSSDILFLSVSALEFVDTTKHDYEYWFDSPLVAQRGKSNTGKITFDTLPTGEHILNIRARSFNSSHYSEIAKINVSVSPTGSSASQMEYLYYVLTLMLLSWLSYRFYLKTKSEKTINAQIKENQQRLELALLDEKRGIWDCYIAPKDYKLSRFTIYQFQHEALELSLEQYIALVHPDDTAKAKRHWEKFLTGKTRTFNHAYRSFFFQKWFWNRISGKINSYYKNGNPKRATGIWIDINKEKKTEDNLSLYGSAFQSTQDIIFVLDKDLKITLINKAFEYTTGFSADKLIGNDMAIIAATQFRKKETESIRKSLEKNDRWHGQSSVPRKNGPSLPVDVRINVIIKNNEEIGYVLVLTELIQSRELKRSSSKNSFYDRITGLPSKTLAFDRLRQQLTYCKKNSDSLSLIFLGIDQFNKLKSALPPGLIDILVGELTNRLLPYFQQEDLLSRYEPDTFLIILRHYHEDNNVLHTVNQLLRELSKPFELNDQIIKLSACAGISSYPDDGEHWSELITKGETALAQTRKQGENLFKFYHDDSNQKALERVDIENKLSKAVSEGELFLVFQPVVNLATNKTIELDINLRWRTDDEKIIYPSQFLPVVSELNMINEFSDWLVNKSFSTLNRWNQEGLTVCVNINLTIDYLSSRRALNLIKQRIADYKVNPKYVFISILEDDPSFDRTNLTRTFKELYALGLNLVLDNFGKVDGAIQNLKTLRFHSVKLAHNLTRNIAKSQQDDKILASILNMLNNLDIGSVAKGIEDENQLDFLKEYGCRYAQGYHISDPLDESQARQYLLGNSF